MNFLKNYIQTEVPTMKKKFDLNGRLTEFARSLFDTNAHSITNYSYDEFGNLSQERVLSANGRMEITSYNYLQLGDSADHIISKMEYSSDPERVELKQYYYNKKNQLIEVRKHSGFRWDYVDYFQYDTYGNMVKELKYNVEKRLKYDKSLGFEKMKDNLDIYYKYEFTYNKNGSLKESIKGCADYLVAAACLKTKYNYDKKGRLVKKEFSWLDSLTSRREYQYNTDNTLKKIEYYWRDDQKSKNFIDFVYDNKILTKAIFTDDTTVTVFEFNYKLDTHSNWIEQQKFVDGKLFYTRKREITYWD